MIGNNGRWVFFGRSTESVVEYSKKKKVRAVQSGRSKGDHRKSQITNRNLVESQQNL